MTVYRFTDVRKMRTAEFCVFNSWPEFAGAIVTANREHLTITVDFGNKRPAQFVHLDGLVTEPATAAPAARGAHA